MVSILPTPFLKDEEASKTQRLRKERTEPAKHSGYRFHLTRTWMAGWILRVENRMCELVKGSRYKYEQVAVIHWDVSSADCLPLCFFWFLLFLADLPPHSRTECLNSPSVDVMAMPRKRIAL
jgi:hypothetical protein